MDEVRIATTRKPGDLPAQTSSRWAILLGLTVSLTACVYLPFGYTALSDVLQQSARFENQSVKVRGQVVQVTKIPLLDVRFYLLEESGHRITVMAGESIPSQGSWVAVVGVVQSFAIVGGQSLGVHLREQRRVDLKYLRFFR